jgi:hypothetical protein
MGVGLIVLTVACMNTFGYERYKNPTNETANCSTCHGDFTDGTSTKGSVFFGNNKHTMHRANGLMETDCDLCHTSGDNRNPFTGSSDGKNEVPGLGCTGCHEAVGLRAHHTANGVTECAGCHDDSALSAVPENVKPPYYGTSLTQVDNPCNDVPTKYLNENWTENDFIGLDNDGNNVYDTLDPACTPYRIIGVAQEGNDVRITWETAGGRTDVLQVAPGGTAPYLDLGLPLLIPGTGPVTTNVLDVGGAIAVPARVYRMRLIP